MNDDLKFFKGLINAFLLSIPIWALIFYLIYRL